MSIIQRTLRDENGRFVKGDPVLPEYRHYLSLLYKCDPTLKQYVTQKAFESRQSKHYRNKVYCSRCRKFYNKKNTQLSKKQSYLLCIDCGTRVRLYARGRSSHYRRRLVKRI